MKVYTLTIEELQQHANLVAACLAARLKEDGIVKEVEDITDNYIIVVARKGKFASYFDRLFGKPSAEGEVMYCALKTK